MQLEKIEKIEKSLKSEDEHVINMWRPFNLKINNKYKYIKNGIFFNICSTILYCIIWPILAIYNKAMYNFKIYGIKNLKGIKGGKITVSNHVHPMDCTMNALAVSPKKIYFPTLKSNFEIPIVRHIIRLLHAFPIPEKNSQKKDFLKAIYTLLEKNKIVHFYPEASLWPYYKKLRKFKNGAFDIACEENVPIVPMVYKFVEPYGIWKYIKKKPLIELHILEPVYANLSLNKKEAVYDLRNKVYCKMKDKLET